MYEVMTPTAGNISSEDNASRDFRTCCSLFQVANRLNRHLSCKIFSLADAAFQRLICIDVQTCF